MLRAVIGGVFGLLSLVAASTGVHGQSVQETVRRYQLIGEWSANCAAPLKEAQRVKYMASPGGGITRRLITEKFTKDMPVDFAGSIDSNRLDLRYVDDGHTIQLVIVFENGRHRTLESRNDKGEIGVKDGIMQATGKETRWSERCGN